MIADPMNDRECLGAITDRVRTLAAEDATLRELAGRFPTTEALVSWIRGLPQRDDTGDPKDGPKVDACHPAQRLRIPADDPNCVERAALYLAVAELIDAGSSRQLVTIDTPNGPHTFPVEDCEPVVLDPSISRNALEGGLFQLEAQSRRLTTAEAVEWVAALAQEPAAQHRNGMGRVAGARAALRGVLRGRPLEVRQARDAGWMLRLAEQEARHFGPGGVAVVRQAARNLGKLEARATAQRNARTGARRNGPSLQVGDYRLRPAALPIVQLARVAGRIGGKAAVAGLRYKLASLGLTPALLDDLEDDLNQEGLTLGPLAVPPPQLGTFDALTTDAVIGRYLAKRIG